MPVQKRIPYVFTSPITASGGLILGASTNTSLGTILSGSATFVAASTTSGATYVSTFTVTGAPAGAKVWVMPCGTPACQVLTGACVTSVNTVSASILNTGGSTSTTTTMTMQYLIIS